MCCAAAAAGGAPAAPGGQRHAAGAGARAGGARPDAERPGAAAATAAGELYCQSPSLKRRPDVFVCCDNAAPDWYAAQHLQHLDPRCQLIMAQLAAGLHSACGPALSMRSSAYVDGQPVNPPLHSRRRQQQRRLAASRGRRRPARCTGTASLACRRSCRASPASPR